MLRRAPKKPFAQCFRKSPKSIKIGAELQPAAGRGPAEDEETNQDMAGIHL